MANQNDSLNNKIDNPESDDTELLIDEQPETPFLKKYNDRLEMPIAVVASIFAHTLFVVLTIFVLYTLLNRKDREAIPIMAVDGMDESGVGSAGSGGVAEPIVLGDARPTAEDLEKFNLPKPLTDIKKELLDKLDITDPDIKIPDAEAAAIGSLNEAIRDKFNQFGQKKGDGNSTGSGASGQVGNGPGGFGSDSTRARSMRWVMRFTLTDGRDYLRQLAVLKATILIPVPPNNKDMMIFTDLVNAKPNRVANTSEIETLSKQMRFCDITAKAVNDIAQTLRLDFTPQSFFVFFPKDLEQKLAQDEENYKGRKSKDIEETIFKVTVTGGEYRIVIVDQTPKKK